MDIYLRKAKTTTTLMFCQIIMPIPVPDYGQLVKIRANGRVVRKEKRTIYGNPDPRDIETTDVENYNGILRERIGRLMRKTKRFSKRRRMLKCSLQLFQFYRNFINGFKRRTSPAMSEGLADHL